MPLELEAVRAFMEVAEQGSFTRAAARLGASKSRVSLSVAALEQEVGARLLLRTTRAVRLTAEGEQFLPRAVRLVQEADELSSLFAPSRSLTGRLRVDLPVGLARNFIIPRLPEFIAAHPLLQLQVSATDRQVDVLREGFDCVLRVGVLADSTLQVMHLGFLPMVNCASAAYLLKFGVPRTLADLDRHVVVHYSSRLGEDPPVFDYREDGKAVERPMRAIITVNSSDAYHAACLAGLGLVQVPRIAGPISAGLADGTLGEVLGEYTSPPLPVSLVHGYARSVPRRVRTFMTWLARILRPHLAAG